MAAEERRVLKPPHESNEITAIPELQELLDLKGMIITIDAMGCQKKIVEKEADYVISLSVSTFSCGFFLFVLY